MKMKKQLEKVYLLNVLLYLDDIETIETFISVNKKCQEVTEMIHYFDVKKPKTEKNNENNYRRPKLIKIIPENLFVLFPKIETICCNLNDVLNHQQIMEEIEFIELDIKTEYNDDNDTIQKTINSIPENIRNKVRKIKIRDSYDKINIEKGLLQYFQYCRILKVIYPENLQKIISFLGKYIRE